MGGAAAAGAGSRDKPTEPAAPAVPMGPEGPEGSDVRALTSVSSIAPRKQLSGAVRERPGGRGRRRLHRADGAAARQAAC